VATAILHFARWLAWQLSDHDMPAEPHPARITVISGGDSPS